MYLYTPEFYYERTHVFITFRYILTDYLKHIQDAARMAIWAKNVSRRDATEKSTGFDEGKWSNVTAYIYFYAPSLLLGGY